MDEEPVVYPEPPAPPMKQINIFSGNTLDIEANGNEVICKCRIFVVIKDLIAKLFPKGCGCLGGDGDYDRPRSVAI